MTRSIRKMAALPAATAANLMLAPAVMMFRLPIMASEAGDANSWRTETTKAVTEKAAAVAEGMVGAQMSLVRSMWAFWPEVMSGKVPSLASGRALEQATDAALKPAGRRVRANYRRLSKG